MTAILATIPPLLGALLCYGLLQHMKQPMSDDSVPPDAVRAMYYDKHGRYIGQQRF